MTPIRKAPHCRTCHKPLKGHKRGVCDEKDLTEPDPIPLAKKSGGTKSAPLPNPVASSPPPTQKPTRGTKSVTIPAEPLPTLSPQSNEILINILRSTPSCSEPTFYMPGALRNAPIRDANNLHVALARLSMNDKGAKKIKTLSESRYTPAEVQEDELPGEEEHDLVQDRGATVSQRLGSAVESDGDSETSAPPTHAQRHISSPVAPPAEMLIQNLLNGTAQSSQHPRVTIFSFPADGVPALEEEAHCLGLFVHVLPLLSADEHWVLVVVGRNASAVKKLLEDSERLAQAVRKSRDASVGKFRIGMGHIMAGTLGALATWAGLAYS